MNGGDDEMMRMDIEEDEDDDMDIDADEEDEDDEMDVEVDEEAEEEHPAPAYPVVVALPATAPLRGTDRLASTCTSMILILSARKNCLLYFPTSNHTLSLWSHHHHQIPFPLITTPPVIVSTTAPSPIRSLGIRAAMDAD
ncbi:hypothetical protein Tco_0483973 [Tanacetum coccineum]|uniref:Uncharacterized protein n=1 Tax=Tanacetum coccineum TaxID=301880 RepID=A0ABQ5A1D6_9ASTR